MQTFFLSFKNWSAVSRDTFISLDDESINVFCCLLWCVSLNWFSYSYSYLLILSHCSWKTSVCCLSSQSIFCQIFYHVEYPWIHIFLSLLVLNRTDGYSCIHIYLSFIVLNRNDPNDTKWLGGFQMWVEIFWGILLLLGFILLLNCYNIRSLLNDGMYISIVLI